MVERAVAVEGSGTSMSQSLSPSRAKDFQQCGLKWWFGSIAGWRTPPTRHTLLGNVVHAAFEDLYKAPADERTKTYALELLEESWAKARIDDANAKILADADEASALNDESRLAVSGLWDLELPHEVEVDAEIGIEAWVEATIGKATVGGRIDRHTDHEVWRITDYKTGRVPAPRYVEAALFGLWTYAAVMAASHPERRIPDEVELLYVGKGVRIRRPILRPYLLAHARVLSHIWMQASASVDACEVVARTGPLCGWCDFRPACPVVSGKSVPMPGSVESNAVLVELGLTQRRREPLADTATLLDDELLDEASEGEAEVEVGV